MSETVTKAIKEVLDHQNNPPQKKELSAVDLAMIEVMEMLEATIRAKALKKGTN